MDDIIKGGDVLSNILESKVVVERFKHDLFHGTDTVGLEIPDWKSFNTQIGGMRRGEITVVTGDTSTGKTTWTLNIFYQLVKMGIPIFIVSSEMPNTKVMSKFISMHTGLPYTVLRREENKELLGNAIDYFLSKPIYFLNLHGSIEVDKLSEYIVYVSHRFGVNYVMLDHLHYFVSAGNDNPVGEIERFMRGIVTVSRDCQTHIMLIAHPAKLNNDTGHVSMNNIKGSSSIKQDSHNIITLWRNKELRDSKLFVNFVKVRDDAGREGSLTFDFCYESQLYKEPLCGLV